MTGEGKENLREIAAGVKGEIKIADDVVAVIASLAAQEVEGIGRMTGGIGKTIMSYVGVKKADKGARVEVADGVVRVDLSITVQYGFSIPDVCKAVQEKVKNSIETMTGLIVADVNVNVARVEMEASTAS